MSKIEWTDKTWNPVVGCTRVSAGCDNCYAVRVSYRLDRMGQEPYKGLTVLNGNDDRHFNGNVRCLDDVLAKPLHWRKPLMIFVNSMSDLFHKDVPFDFVDKVFAVMTLCPQHTFQILTKRPDRMAEYLNRGDKGAIPLHNVWLGTSVEDQSSADERIPHVLECPAVVRFLSCEPLLGPLELSKYITLSTKTHMCASVSGLLRNNSLDCLFDENNKPYSTQEARRELIRIKGTGAKKIKVTQCDNFSDQTGCLGHENPSIDWVIVGGESGPVARPMHPAWARSIRDQCISADVPFFFKQWGEWCDSSQLMALRPAQRAGIEYVSREDLNRLKYVRMGTNHLYRVGKIKAGRMLSGQTWDEMPKTGCDCAV